MTTNDLDQGILHCDIGRVDVEKLPWLCGRCAHFVVRPAGEPEPPSHECKVAGGLVVFEQYTSSEQAEHIRRRIA